MAFQTQINKETVVHNERPFFVSIEIVIIYYFYKQIR